jgi:aspartate 1-decarboxylase
MLIEILKSKIHHATVTECDLYYAGSIAIDENLMEAANLFENEKVHVYNLNNGERMVTYVIRGRRGSGIISLNGPAARKAALGDHLIVAAFATINAEEAKTFKPIIVFPDEHNQPG